MLKTSTFLPQICNMNNINNCVHGTTTTPSLKKSGLIGTAAGITGMKVSTVNQKVVQNTLMNISIGFNGGATTTGGNNLG